MTPEEIEASRRRIAALEARAAEQRAAVRDLRARLGGAPRRWPLGLALGLAAAIVAGGVLLGARAREADRIARHPLAPVDVASLEAPTPRSDPAAGDEPIAEAPLVRVPSASEVSEVGARCPRPALPRRTLDEALAAVAARRGVSVVATPTPGALRVVDFRACTGCPCCTPALVFGEPGPSGERADPACFACSRAATLRSIGIAPVGWVEPRPVGGRGLVLTIDPPAAVVALELSEGLVSHDDPGNRPNHLWFSAVAHDGEGRVLAADRAVLWRDMEESEPPGRHPPYVVVEACPGELIARVDVASEMPEHRVDVARIAVLPGE